MEQKENRIDFKGKGGKYKHISSHTLAVESY